MQNKNRDRVGYMLPKIVEKESATTLSGVSPGTSSEQVKKLWL